ncbi:aminodeoxychorismate synthase component I [Streptomyces sp. NPDC006261]|uniref:aminodeoxychorismate synthase component I n=1 Tax=Streptomyces sp. NPDC006261 TaxID=3156739 RepID=UPI0033A062CF
MRTLLVDNHDSFTYNLFDYLAQISGHEPTVVHNDEAGWKTGHLRHFDRVVISPGPEHPSRQGDFGISADIIRASAVPLLGVCLGHQGIALASGGLVVPAPEPWHGRVSSIVHTGTGVFAGIPARFEAVRYHSLAVTDVPDELEVTARTDDGVVMGLRHRHRPLHGVQFHPESIGTEHGMRILRNFIELPEENSWRAPRARAGAPRATVGRSVGSGGAPRPRRPSAPLRLRVHTQRLRTRWDAEAVFGRLHASEPFAFWLDSSSPGGPLGRFSVMGDASGPLARVATADVSSGTVQVASRAGTEIVTGDFLDWLDADLRGTVTDVPELPGDFALGWVGYLGYELKPPPGGGAAHRSEEPDAAMVFADRAVVFDHDRGTTHLLALSADAARDPAEPGTGEEAARSWLRRTAARLEALADDGEPEPPPGPPPAVERVELRHSRSAYLDLVASCQDRIREGESYEICLTNMAEARVDLDPWQSYRRLRRSSPAPFAALLRFDGLSVLSSSPERFLRVGADGVAESRPIKGTRPRGATPARDAALARELGTDEKERAENLMIVDLVRNDLGRCAETGSVVARDILRVETYATLHQLVSTVTARLRDDAGAIGCVRSAFPGGSMTGAPKERTMRIIQRLEDGPRGVYSGAVGYFSLNGAADLSIVIRTAVITPGRVRYGVGGAVTALSDPEAEFEETVLKAKPLFAMVASALPHHESVSAVRADAFGR